MSRRTTVAWAWLLQKGGGYYIMGGGGQNGSAGLAHWVVTENFGNQCPDEVPPVTFLQRRITKAMWRASAVGAMP